MKFQPFESWQAVLDSVKIGEKLWYHAPLDITPRSVRCESRRGNKVRVFPWTKQTDPFTADSGHLDRFRKLVPA